MRVGNSGIDHLGSAGASSITGVGSDSQSSTSRANVKSDSVSLSNAASLIALAKASGASRQSKVQSLAADVRSGTYSADSGEVSHALVQSHIQG